MTLFEKQPFTSLKRILSDWRGESLVETLAALLIAMLAAVLLATMVLASTNISISSEGALSEAYGEESRIATASSNDGIATISLSDSSGKSLIENVAVHVYTSDDGSLSRYESARLPGGDTP